MSLVRHAVSQIFISIRHAVSPNEGRVDTMVDTIANGNAQHLRQYPAAIPSFRISVAPM